jgi:hypothetical protein
LDARSLQALPLIVHLRPELMLRGCLLAGVIQTLSLQSGKADFEPGPVMLSAVTCSPRRVARVNSHDT